MALAERRPYGLSRWLANTPRWFSRLGPGWLLGHRAMRLTHRGRTGGLVRQTILDVPRGDPRTREVLVVSGWEGKTDWYRNIGQVGKRRLHVQAVTVPPAAGVRVPLDYRQRHLLAARELSRLTGWNLISASARELERAVQESLPAVGFRWRARKAEQVIT
jgi:hypothetical protein